MTERMDTCANCRFYGSFPDMVSPNGQRRRKAPVVMDRSWEHPSASRQNETSTEFPLVMATDWCGEYEPKRG